MNEQSIRHLGFLQTIYPDLCCQLRYSPFLSVATKPQALLALIGQKVIQVLNFDALLQVDVDFEGVRNQFVMLIDENINYGGYDTRGVPFDWKIERLQKGRLTNLQWSYWHISGNETNQVCSPQHLRFPMGGTIAGTLQALNAYTYGQYSRN